MKRRTVKLLRKGDDLISGAISARPMSVAGLGRRDGVAGVQARANHTVEDAG